MPPARRAAERRLDTPRSSRRLHRPTRNDRMGKLGVLIVGLGGAVASTVAAGVELMLRGAVPCLGMLTESTPINASRLPQLLDFAPLKDLVFGGWDVRPDDVYTAATRHRVLPAESLRLVKAALSRIHPLPGVFSESYAKNVEGEHLVAAKSFRDEVEIIQANIEAFKRERGLDRVVVVNLASTEAFIERS